ncbi:hypothetical protein [Paraburkholderia sp. BCC1886]|uniref:hypothetical protein n=1 Tax=Paraburkholderia sp. BCC1886 TaxID=2562670 RepID=UPI0011830FD6|nr:hypothetical protein [Paraburkholderia sp. BCC1886]
MMDEETSNLVDSILCGIDDESLLDRQIAGPSPLTEVVLAYRALSVPRLDLRNLDARSTGRDLKDAIKSLDPEQQVAILARYSKATKDLTTPNEYDPKVLKEKTKSLQRQIYWLGGAFVFFLFAVMIGLVLATAVHMGVLSSGQALSGMLDTAKQIVELWLDLKTG